ncbi:putative nucleotide-binding protein [Actinoplanes tereljensis]|uniref:CD-NTase-associated protein 12/Pycsar effector protein TIR domain-containing protein n=1 Tax=Paractinoplanes tereljensis TaxID=571912 RepID=A0A919NK50_9ACTN|nr:nucleotide-binding protein [Actinoplanes tereljensis]GIF20236.1 hypothetical protein Ate02nite_29660 [Actinoplanes tereljensis]
MKLDRAVQELKSLKDAAAGPEVQRDGAVHDAWKAKAAAVMRQALGDESPTLQQFNKIGYHIGIYSGALGEAERDRQYFAQQVQRAAALIEAAIFEAELASDDGPPTPEAERPKTIFLVHGHDAARYDVARFVERITGMSPVILAEQASRGKTLVEKFEEHAADATYAIVLLTPDDVGRVKGAGSAADQPRARQNVVFELGFFFGKLGRDRVAVINSGVEKPSDVHGLNYIDYPGGKWQLELAKELHAAGISVDMARLF